MKIRLISAVYLVLAAAVAWYGKYRVSSRAKKVLCYTAFVVAVLAVETCYQYNTNLTWRNREIVGAIIRNDQAGYALENTTIEKISEFQTLVTIPVQAKYLFRGIDRQSPEHITIINESMKAITNVAVGRINWTLYEGMEQNLPFPTGHITLHVYADSDPDNGMYCTRLTQYNENGNSVGYYWHFLNLVTGESTEKTVRLK